MLPFSLLSLSSLLQDLIATAEDGTVASYDPGDLCWVMMCSALVWLMSESLSAFSLSTVRREGGGGGERSEGLRKSQIREGQGSFLKRFSLEGNSSLLALLEKNRSRSKGGSRAWEGKERRGGAEFWERRAHHEFDVSRRSGLPFLRPEPAPITPLAIYERACIHRAD